MAKLLPLGLIISLLITYSLFIYTKVLPNNFQGQVAGQSSVSPESVFLSLTIGEYRYVIFGYSSPFAQVKLEGTAIFDQTTADKKGYFEFANRYSPLKPTETCLTAQDQLGRLSNPVCLPAFPLSYEANIGPIILPPTLSLDKSNYFIGDEVLLTGQTIPNTDVNLSLFTDTGKENSKLETLNPKQIQNSNNLNYKQFKTFENSDLFRVSNLGFKVSDFFVRPISAFTFPELIVRSEDKGNFSVALPSSATKNYRFFSQTKFLNQFSPRSLTLNLKILPVWMIIIQLLLFLFSLLKPRLLEIIILVQIISLFVYFLRQYFQPKAIVIRMNYDLMERNMEIVKKENYLPMK